MIVSDAQSLVIVNSATAIRNAIQFWAESTTRSETFERAFKLQDKMQAVSTFFAFTEKHPGEISAEGVQRWRRHLESRGQKPATVYARISRLSSFYKWLMADAQVQSIHPLESGIADPTTLSAALSVGVGQGSLGRRDESIA